MSMIKSSNLESLEDAIDESLIGDDNSKDLIASIQNTQTDLGLTDEALNEAITYIAGTSDVPKFMESFSIEKLKNITSIATISQVSRVPGLIKLLNEANNIILASGELRTLDIEDLTKFSKSVGDELNSILDHARKTMDSLQKMETTQTANQKLLDQLLNMPDEELLLMKEWMAAKHKEKEMLKNEDV